MKFAYRSHSQWDGISFNKLYKEGIKDLHEYEWQNFIDTKEVTLFNLENDIDESNLYANKSIFFFYFLIKALK